MGFDMYHAMSAEQEAKSSLNRPMPIPLSRRGGGAEPAKILGGGAEGGTPSAGATSAGAPSGGGGAGANAGASGGAAAAGGAVAAGAFVAKEAASAGPRLGNFVAAQANGHAEASPPAAPPHVADSALSGSPSRN